MLRRKMNSLKMNMKLLVFFWQRLFNLSTNRSRVYCMWVCVCVDVVASLMPNIHWNRIKNTLKINTRSTLFVDGALFPSSYSNFLIQCSLSDRIQHDLCLCLDRYCVMCETKLQNSIQVNLVSYLDSRN